MVGGWREERQDRTYRRVASRMHNRITSAIVGVPMHDYGCMLRAYRRAYRRYGGRLRREGRVCAGACQFVRQRVAEIPVAHAERHDGESKYDVFRLAHLKLQPDHRILEFPIQAMSLAAIGIFLLDALFVAVLLAHRLVYGPQQEGALWVLFAFTFALSGLVMLALGLIGEYIGRIYLEVRRRPTYIVRAIHRESRRTLRLRRAPPANDADGVRAALFGTSGSEAAGDGTVRGVRLSRARLCVHQRIIGFRVRPSRPFSLTPIIPPKKSGGGRVANSRINMTFRCS